jgi:hypothetical protein
MVSNGPPIRWQTRMAPLMVGAVILSAAVFTTITIWQFRTFQAQISEPVATASMIAWTAPGREPSTFQQQLQLSTTEAGYNLERELIARRYDEANLTFTTRLWTRLMGFLTGMILALVGAAFVLGKLETERSELGGSAQGLSFTVQSTSPGIVMGVLGTILMAIAIVVPATVTTHDGAIYFLPSSAVALEPPPLGAIQLANPANHNEPLLKSSLKAGGNSMSNATRPRVEPSLKTPDTERKAPQ